MKLILQLTLAFLICILSLFLMLQFVPFISKVSVNQLILISMDGFRHDYIEKVKQSGRKLPNFDYLINEGSRIMRIQNAFPTITLPNHQTLVTGLYPENHGIVLNTFIDKNWPNEMFNMNNQDNLNDPKWFVGWPEPIWVTLQKKGYLTASHLWPLTDAPVKGELPFFQESQYTLLDNSQYFPFMKRVEDVVYWLSSNRARIDFVMLYFPEPDETGHAYGPNSSTLYDEIVVLDGVLGHLIALLKNNSLWNKVNIILTADHGMSENSQTREIPLDNYIDPNWYTYTLLTPIGALYPIPGKEEDVYNGLKNKNPHLEVYRRSEVPTSLNYNIDNGRIAPLIIIAENGWAIVHKASNGTATYGNHGYNNSEPDVQPVFIAQGPNFRKTFSIPFGYSVDVYPLICHLMGIKPNANNGSLARMSAILEPNERSTGFLFLSKYRMLILILSAVILTVLVAVFIIVSCLKRKRKVHKYCKFNDDAIIKP